MKRNNNNLKKIRKNSSILEYLKTKKKRKNTKKWNNNSLNSFQGGGIRNNLTLLHGDENDINKIKKSKKNSKKVNEINKLKHRISIDKTNQCLDVIPDNETKSKKKTINKKTTSNTYTE